MASSSHFIPASRVSQSWNHDVFISFRGEDTRKGFVSHLYEALVREGIQTFKDDKTLTRGESIGPALQKAIQESRIAVIVFSKNYANSSWCLDELAYIIECKDKRKQIVMPVFYDIDPSDLRKQTRKYGEAFNNKHKTESWRNVVVEASNLSGWVLNDFANGDEAKCIKNIVEKISDRLPQIIPSINKDLIGIETRLQDLKSVLDIRSSGVRMIGIWGVGGGGKTTLASAAYMEISHQFEAYCLLENIREESNKHGLTKMQERFLYLIAKTNVVIGSEMEGRIMIERKLCHKRVLVVLDDVNECKQLEALAGSPGWFGEGSRIIITTRDKHLLTLKEATIYEVSLLSYDEAIKLFRKHAYRKDKPVEDYEMLSQAVVSYAGGLPLALEILGSFLYDKDKDEWMSVLAKLKRIPYPDVTKRLKISYDGLEPDEKKLFLDITCLFRRVEIDDAMTVLGASNFQPRIAVRVLIQKSLIKVSDGRFDMHDLVEEMAHYIVRGEHHDNPEKLSRIWKTEDIVNLCAMGAAAPEMETEVLALRDHVLHNIIKIWKSQSNYDNHQRLLDVIGIMKKLRWIEWYMYPAFSFPSNFQPTKLGCLVLKSSKLKQLWEGNKHLPNLKILDLGGSRDLIKTPDFEGLPRLERLILNGCISLEEIHPSIGYLERLVLVKMFRCKKLKTFPPIIRMKKLKTLDISLCFELHMFPEMRMNMESLVNLILNWSGIEIIPSSVGQFCTTLVTFDLSNCKKLKRIEGNFRLLKRLKQLRLNGCFQLEKLDEDFFDEECCLEEFSLSVIPKLLQFPRFLRKLDLSWGNFRDGDIPSDMSGLLNLQVLDLSFYNFSRLHFSLSQIPSLKFLNLSDCWSLEELPELPSSIAILKVESCESLQSVGDLSNCKWLWKVSLWNSNMLIGGGRVVHSILQRNAVEDRFMSIMLPRMRLSHSEELMTMTLQPPQNWYNDFCGFSLSADGCNMYGCRIVIKDSQHDHDHHREEFDKNPESFNECGVVGYVPFGSLRRTSWWNPTYTNITFQIKGLINPKVGLVPRKSKSSERSIDHSECWEDIGHTKTFQIIDNPKSSQIEIKWRPSVF